MGERDNLPPSSAREAQLDPGEMTPDLFWEQYGAKFDPDVFPREGFDKMWAVAEAFSPDFEQHNFDHTKETLWEAMALADLCEDNGEPTDRVALVLGSLFHDVGEGQQYYWPRFPSAEAYAAAVCTKFARSLQPELPEDTISLAGEIINNTHPDGEPRTREGKIMVLADLKNVGEDYEKSFLVVTKRLWQEKLTRTLGSASEVDFLQGSIKLLYTYLAKDLSLGAFDKNAWKQQAMENVNRLNEELQWAQQLISNPVHVGRMAVSTIMDLLPLSRENIE